MCPNCGQAELKEKSGSRTMSCPACGWQEGFPIRRIRKPAYQPPDVPRTIGHTPEGFELAARSDRPETHIVKGMLTACGITLPDESSYSVRGKCDTPYWYILG